MTDKRKIRRRERALLYWVDEYKNLRPKDKHRIPYIKSQISILTQKLKDDNVVKPRVCALCGKAFMPYDPFAYICPGCFGGMAGAMLSESFRQLDISMNVAAAAIRNFSTVFGVPPHKL